MRRTVISALVATAVGIGFAGNYEYTWDAENPHASFGDGLVTLTIDGATVSSLQVNAAKDDVVTFAGDAMDFAANASVTVNRGLLRFDNAVNAAGDLNVVAGNVPAAWATAVSEGTLFSDVFTTVLQGISLDEVEVAAGHLGSSASGGAGTYNATPYFVTRGEGWMEVQLQQFLGGDNSTKVVKIRLEQDRADVKAKILYAKYVRAKDALGIDFDKSSATFKIESQGVPGSQSRPTYYYSCDKVSFRLLKGVAAAKVAGAFVCAGKVNVTANMTFGVVNQPKLSVSADLPEDAVLSVETDAAGPSDQSRYELGPVLKDWRLFAANRKLIDINLDSIAGKLAGSSLSTTPLEAKVCYVRWYSHTSASTVLFAQFQVNSSGSTYTKGILLKFRQQGDNVEVAPSGAYYYEGMAGDRSFEESGISGGTIAESPTASGYCLASVSAEFALQGASLVTLASVGLSAGGTIEVSGASDSQHAELVVDNASALPKNSHVRVGANGILSMLATSGWNTGVAGGTVDYYIGPGGKLRQGSNVYNSFPIPFSVSNRELVIDGGEAEFGVRVPSSWTASSTDPVDTSGSTYLNNLSLMNGARCYGRAVRLGNGPAKWTVTGSSPSVWDTSISLLGGSGGDGTDEFAVDDTTGSDAVDFTVTGDMKMFKSDSYKRLHVKKTGAGTMKVCGETDFTYYPLEIAGGTWMVGSATTMSTAQNVQLSGGVFASADGVSASVGKLLVGGAGGGIVAGVNATVSFLDSSDQTWLGTVNITCPEGASVRFGTSASALTAAQQGRLRINGKKAVLDEDGYAVPSGLIMLLR